MRKRTPQRMADAVANGGSKNGSYGTQREGPSKRARCMGEIVDEWEIENGPRVQEEIFENPLENNEDDNDLADDTEGESTIRKTGRGLANRWEGWGKGKKIIEWDDNCSPIGENAAKLASQLGTYARNGILFPLYWTSWDGISKEVLEMVWKDVKVNTNAPDGYKTLCFNKLNRSWNAFKHELKENYYLPYDTVSQCLAVVPPEVKADQWPELVRYWSMESTQRKKVNKPTDIIRICRATRSKKGKYTDDEGAAELEETLQRRLDELPEEERDDPEKRGRIFLDVIRNEGDMRVLCGGAGTRLRSAPYEASASSIRDYEAKIARLQEEATERDCRDAERDRRDKERDCREEERDRRDEKRDQRHHEEIAELKAQFHEQIAELKAQLQVALQSTADSEARVIRMFQSARFSMILPSPSP